MARKTNLVRKLTLKERLIIGLSANGHPDDEISEALNLEQNNVRQLRRKGLLKLKETE